MRTLIAAGALAFASASHAAAPDHYALRTASDLARVCGTPSSASDYATAIAFCHRAATPPAERCDPNPAPTRAKVAEQFVAWMKTRPQLEGDNAVDALFRFAAEAYPCKR
jgi:hypothetical protein